MQPADYSLLHGATTVPDHHINEMEQFDFEAPADVFAGGGRGGRGRPMQYRRFHTGAEALRHAIEDLPADLQFGAVVEMDGVRFGATEIRGLYDSTAYPLPRRRTQ